MRSASDLPGSPFYAPLFPLNVLPLGVDPRTTAMTPITSTQPIHTKNNGLCNMVLAPCEMITARE